MNSAIAIDRKVIFNKSTIITVLVISMFLFLSVSCNGQRTHQVPQYRFDDIERWVRAFEDPQRDEWQKPDKVVESLNIKNGDVIADIGAGTGYFTRRFAVATGPDGKALGLDIEKSMVHYMKEDARKLDLPNYEARVVKPDNPALDDNTVDIIFLCNTYHHIQNRVEYFRKASTSLKPGGRLVIVDFYKRELPYGPPPEHKLSRERVISELKQAGYRLQKTWDFLPYQYFLEFGS